MPVTVHPASHAARKWHRSGPPTTPSSLLEASFPVEFNRCNRIIHSSFTSNSLQSLPSPSISPSRNGLVYAAWLAYSNHHNLVLRPEDVWFAILSQLSFYINRNSEELRGKFVAHKGRKELEVCRQGPSIDTVDVGEMAVLLTREMDQYLVDPVLRQWTVPDFTTTMPTDKVTAAVLMLGAMKKYFTYSMCVCCGIPSVTLLGIKGDWYKLLRRIEYMPRLGPEAALFAEQLRPVLGHFVQTFDAPTDPAVVSFWARIVHEQDNGSGPSYLGGWMTAFCFWGVDGRRLDREELEGYIPEDKRCVVDGVRYHIVDTGAIPDGVVSVPVKVVEHGVKTETRMLAGLMGIRGLSSISDQTRSEQHPEDGEVELHTIQPVSGWLMYEVKK